MWCWRPTTSDNRGMELDQAQIDELEAALDKLEQMDPAELPEPAAELAELLGRLLEQLDE